MTEWSRSFVCTALDETSDTLHGIGEFGPDVTF
jgi:hypothetical protein